MIAHQAGEAIPSMVSLEELQRALAARLTSNATLAEENLSALAGFDASELAHSQETLVRKRLSQIASLLPRTRRAMDADYVTLCRTFIGQHHFDGYQAPQIDAIEFSRWLNKQPAIAGWKLELAAWEALSVQWCTHRFLWRYKFFSFNIQDSIVGQTEPPKRRSLWLVVRLGQWGRWQRLI